MLRYQVDITPPVRPPSAKPPARPSRGAKADEEDEEGGPKLPTDLCRTVLSSLSAKLKWGDGWAYDGGHILFGARDLLPSTPANQEFVAEVALPDARRPGSTETFRISVRALGTFELAKALLEFYKTPGAALPWDALASLDTVLRHRRSLDASWVVLSGNFLHSGAVNQLGNTGLEMWQGYTASTRLGSDARAPGRPSLSLVVDMAAAAFVSAQPAPDYVLRVVNGRDYRSPLAPGAIRSASKAIKGLKVELRIQDASGVEKKRQYRAKGLTLNPASGCMFDNEALGKKESVVAYFERENKVKLQLPHWPCLDVSKEKSRPCWLPLEFCHILAGQRRLLVEDSVASAAISAAHAGFTPVTSGNARPGAICASGKLAISGEAACN